MLTDFNKTRVGIAGLGLIGGSLAKAFSRNGLDVSGMDIDESTVAAALRSGAVRAASTDPGVLKDCGAVFIALGPDEIVPFVKKNHGLFAPGAAVIDCCGIKGPVCAGLDAFSREAGFLFIGGHPMAGTENSGFEASSAGLFSGASFLLTPRPDIPSEVIRRIGELIKRAGFARVVVTTPKKHDRMIAFTSQLPHVLACAYVKSPCCPEHAGYSAGSFRDVSRVAHINASMWARLFIGNREALCREIDGICENIKNIRDAVDAGDYGRLEALLLEARKIKDAVASDERGKQQE